MPTPLGNLRDMTLRALDALRDCDLVVAEDTRVARKLFTLLELERRETWSYREQNAKAVTPSIVARAAAGRVAVCTDAGMPGVSDPGRELVVAARAAGIAIEVLPGPSAFVCAAVLSGFATAPLTFGGFLPRARGERERAFRDAIAARGTTAFYESPHRVVAALETLDALSPDVRVFVARELTKLHEQQALGTPREVLGALERPVRGELVLVVEGLAMSPGDAYAFGAAPVLGGSFGAPAVFSRSSPPVTAGAPHAPFGRDERIASGLAAGEPVAAIAKALARDGFGDRAELYRLVAERKERGSQRADVDAPAT